MTIKNNTFVQILASTILFLFWITPGWCEIPVEIDPHVLREFNAQVKKIQMSQNDLLQSSQDVRANLDENNRAFVAAEDGSEMQIEAANGMVNSMLDAIEKQLPPIERYDVELGKMQELNAKAAKSAKPDTKAATGAKSEIQSYNALLSTMAGWGAVFDQFNNSPELKANNTEMKKILNSMRNEVNIARSNRNRFTDLTFKRLDARLLDYRLRLNTYVRSLKSMVNGIVQSRQSGTVTETLSLLDDLMGSIDEKLIGEFLGPSFTKALEVLSRGRTTETSQNETSPVVDYGDLYIKE